MPSRDVEDFPDTGYGETSQFAAHLDRGWALLDRGDLVAARTSVQHAQEVKPDDPDTAVLQGAIALAEGDPEEALRCYERAIDLDSEYLEPYTAAAQVCLYELDDAPRALRYCNDALELEGLSPYELLDVQLLAAECEVVLGEPAAAALRLGAGPHIDILDATLDLASADTDPAEALDDDDPDRALAAEFLTYDPDGETLEDEERLDRIDRIVHLALRLARLRIEAGDATSGAALAEQLTERFPTEADAWYLLSEVQLRNHKMHLAIEAALRTAELDATAELPAWVPSPSAVHRRVHQILQSCPDAEIRALATSQDRGLSIFVRDTPPLELIAEGIDPRLLALALAARTADAAPESRPELVGIAVYRANVARYSRDGEQFDEELRHAVVEELAFFFGCDDARRLALGLPPLEPPLEAPPPEEAAPPEEPAPPAKRTRRRRATKKTTK